MSKSAPDRCRISLRVEEYETIIAALDKAVPYDAELVRKLMLALEAAKGRGNAAAIEHDLS